MAGVASDRFASLNCEDFDKILTEKNSKNTKRATEMTVKVFRTYLREKELPENFEEASASSLDDQLTRFYGEGRQVNGQKYKTTTLIAIRHGINRHLQLKTAGMDIINSGDFKKSKQMFIAVTKDLKREERVESLTTPLLKLRIYRKCMITLIWRTKLDYSRRCLWIL